MKGPMPKKVMKRPVKMAHPKAKPSGGLPAFDPSYFARLRGDISRVNAMSPKAPARPPKAVNRLGGTKMPRLHGKGSVEDTLRFMAPGDKPKAKRKK